MSTDRFHKAVKDNLLEILKEATRKDCNGRDEAGMTPTLWAAFEGNLDALRLLCGRGGDPDKSDHFGNTALHLAAARGHKECVTFLVNFGANMFATDIDNHTAQELAAINNRDDILRFLDSAIAKLQIDDKKRARTMKEKAKKDSEKTLKLFNKRQSEIEKNNKSPANSLESTGIFAPIDDLNKTPLPHRPSTNLFGWMKRAPSQPNLVDTNKQPTFSEHVGTVSGSRHGKSAVERRLRTNLRKQNPSIDFKVGETEKDGTRTITSITGIRRDSEVMYVGTLPGQENHTRGKLSDVFGVDNDDSPDDEPLPRKSNLIRSVSQPDFIAADDSGLGQEVLLQEPASIFERPGLGSIAFRRSITAATYAMNGKNTTPQVQAEEISIGSASSLAARQKSFQPRWNDDTESSTEPSDDEEDGSAKAALQRFLAAFGLSQYAPKFLDEQIDLDTLMLLTENDLKSLGLPLGPYRKLVNAVQERKNALSSPGALVDSPL